MKKILSMLICLLMLIGTFAPVSFAESGKIDLYEVFSNKDDQAKTEVGSRIYKWSMHLPDDAIIYKSERVNFFNMSTNSCQSSIELEVNKNKDNYTLEEILHNMQSQSKRGYYWFWGDKEFQVDIAEDQWGQRYIRIIKAGGFYDYYLVDKAAEEFREYVENRIYVANNYIYNLTVRMNGEFYRQHEEMFNKLVSSFKLAFNENNPYIKELSDSVSTAREFKNTSYGWKIVLSPYWKVEGVPNARNQMFRPVYSDEELNQDKEDKEEKENEFKIPEGITVSLVSSAENGETSSQWAQKDVEKIRNNYNSKVFEILKNEAGIQNGANVHNVVIRFKTVTRRPYIMHNLYVVGNGYKYLVSAVMMEDKYLDSAKRKSFENMLSSFKLDKTCLSRYLGKIAQAESMFDIRAPKELKMKKYDFATSVTKNWNVNSNEFDAYKGYYDEIMYKEFLLRYDGKAGTNETITAFEPDSNISLSMTAGLNANDMSEIISQRTERFLKDDEIRLRLASIKIQSAEHNGAAICRISKEYDLDAVENFVDEDKTKTYSFERLTNEYEYIVKIGRNTYIEIMKIPVANTAPENLLKIDRIWSNTYINKINYGKLDIKWKQHTLEEFDKEKK